MSSACASIQSISAASATAAAAGSAGSTAAGTTPSKMRGAGRYGPTRTRSHPTGAPFASRSAAWYVPRTSITVWLARVSASGPVSATLRAKGSVRSDDPSAARMTRRIAPASHAGSNSPTTGAASAGARRTTTRSPATQSAAIRSPSASSMMVGSPGSRTQRAGRSSPARPGPRRSTSRPPCSRCAAKLASGSTASGRRRPAQPAPSAAAARSTLTSRRSTRRAEEQECGRRTRLRGRSGGDASGGRGFVADAERCHDPASGLLRQLAPRTAHRVERGPEGDLGRECRLADDPRDRREQGRVAHEDGRGAAAPVRIAVPERGRLYARAAVDRRLEEGRVEAADGRPIRRGALGEDGDALALAERVRDRRTGPRRVAIAPAYDEEGVEASGDGAEEGPPPHLRLGDEACAGDRVEDVHVEPGHVIGDHQRRSPRGWSPAHVERDLEDVEHLAREARGQLPSFARPETRRAQHGARVDREQVSRQPRARPTRRGHAAGDATSRAPPRGGGASGRSGDPAGTAAGAAEGPPC